MKHQMNQKLLIDIMNLILTNEILDVYLDKIEVLDIKELNFKGKLSLLNQNRANSSRMPLSARRSKSLSKDNSSSKFRKFSN